MHIIHENTHIEADTCARWPAYTRSSSMKLLRHHTGFSDILQLEPSQNILLNQPEVDTFLLLNNIIIKLHRILDTLVVPVSQAVQQNVFCLVTCCVKNYPNHILDTLVVPVSQAVQQNVFCLVTCCVKNYPNHILDTLVVPVSQAVQQNVFCLVTCCVKNYTNP